MSSPTAENTFPCEMNDPVAATDIWSRRIRTAVGQIIAGDLYKSLHWQRDRGISDRHTTIELWAVDDPDRRAAMTALWLSPAEARLLSSDFHYSQT